MVRRAEVVEHAGEDRLGALGVERRGHRLGLGRDRLRRFGHFRCGLRPRGDRLGLRLDGDGAGSGSTAIGSGSTATGSGSGSGSTATGSTSTTASTLRRRPKSRAKKPTFGASAAAGSAAAGSGSDSAAAGAGSAATGSGSAAADAAGSGSAATGSGSAAGSAAQLGCEHLRLGLRRGRFRLSRVRLGRQDVRISHRLGLGDRLGRRRLLLRHLSQLRRDRHLRAPSRRLQRHRAACAVALPGDGGLGVQAGDADLSELAQVAGEGVDVRDFRPQLRRALDEGPLRAWILHRVRLSPPARRNPPGPSAVTSPASRRPCRPQGGPIIVHRNY